MFTLPLNIITIFRSCFYKQSLVFLMLLSLFVYNADASYSEEGLEDFLTLIQNGQVKVDGPQAASFMSTEELSELAMRDHRAGFLLIGRSSYFSSEDKSKAKDLILPEGYVEFIKNSAKSDPLAKTICGLLYFHAFGVKEDMKKALKYIKGAASAGETQGEYYYGLFLENGLLGTPRVNVLLNYDFPLAKTFYDKASKKGHVQARENLLKLEEKTLNQRRF